MYLHGLRIDDHFNSRLWLHAAVWLQAKVCERGLELWPSLNDSLVCETVTHSAVEAVYAATALYVNLTCNFAFIKTANKYNIVLYAAARLVNGLRLHDHATSTLNSLVADQATGRL